MTPNLLRAFARGRGSAYDQGEDLFLPSIRSRDLMESVCFSYFPKAWLSLCLHKRVRTKREALPDRGTKTSSPSLSRERPREVERTFPHSCTLYLEWGILKGERLGKIFKNRTILLFFDLNVFEDLVPLPRERRSFGESKCLHLRAEA